MTYYVLPKTNNEIPLLNPIFYDAPTESEINVISNSVRLRRDILLNQITNITRNNIKPRQKLFLKKTVSVDDESITPSIKELSSSPPTPPLLNLTLPPPRQSSLLLEFTEIVGIFNISDSTKHIRPLEFLNFSHLSSSEILNGINFHSKITSPKTCLQSYANNLKQLNLDLDFGIMFFDITSHDQSYSY